MQASEVLGVVRLLSIHIRLELIDHQLENTSPGTRQDGEFYGPYKCMGSAL